MEIGLLPDWGVGSIFSFVPAHGGSRVEALPEDLSRVMGEALGLSVLLADFEVRGPAPVRRREIPKRMTSRTWGALVSDVDGSHRLDVRGVPTAQLGRLLDYAKEYYSVVCVRGADSAEVLRVSDGIFIVANSTVASLGQVREKVEWLRGLNLVDRCGLLLERDRNGASPLEAEDFTGVPVCSLIGTDELLTQLAGWLGTASRKTGAVEYALAV